MTGLFGIVEANRNVPLEKSIGRLRSAFGPAIPYVEEICISDNTAIGMVKRPDDLVHSSISDNNDILLAFWGHLWSSVNPKEKIGIESNVSIAHALVSIYRSEGLTGFYTLNGRFTIALWDKKDRTMYLVSDRYGFRNLFYRVVGGNLLFASEYKSILRCEEIDRGSIDTEALAQFMALGYPLGERTFIEEIRLLPHGSVLVFREGTVKVTPYWDYHFRSGIEPIYEIDEYVDTYFDILRRVLSRQLEKAGPVILPLSGGLDSRTLAGMLDHLGLRKEVKSFSYGDPRCFDVVYGGRIARKVGFNHTYLPLSSTYLRDFAEQFVWLTEGAINCLNSHMLLPHDLLHKNQPCSVITGFLGDVSAGEPIFGVTLLRQEMSEEEFIEEAFDHQADIIGRLEMRSYFKPHVYEHVHYIPTTAYAVDYLKSTADRRYHRAIYAELIGRQRRYTSFNLYLFDGSGEVLAPFTDNEFVDFALALPDVLRQTRYLQRSMIVKYLAKVASVPWGRTRLPLDASELRKGLHWRWERLNKHPLVRATIGRRYAQMHDNYLHADETIRTGSKDFVMRNIRNNQFLAEYFNMDRVHQMLDDHLNGKVNEYGKITAFLTLSLWHKLFIEGKRPNNA